MITISVITPTYRREGLLARCVQSVLAQDAPGAAVEHIVVNDAGRPLAHAPWMDDPRVRVLDTTRTERCVARNTGAALSHGDWLYFLDDDDYALPGAFAAMLALARRHPEAAHLYGGYEVHSETTGQTHTIQPTLQGEMFPAFVAGEAFPPPASWVRRDAFFAVGGFDPLLVPGEDADLFRRVAMRGPVAGTSFVVTVARVEHPQTSTTDTGRQHRRWQEGTEKVLAMPQTLSRVLRETRRAPYWRGRCAREYGTSALRQFGQGRYGTAWSRLTACGRLSFPHGAYPQFWSGLRRDDTPQIVTPTPSVAQNLKIGGAAARGSKVLTSTQSGPEIQPAGSPQSVATGRR